MFSNGFERLGDPSNSQESTIKYNDFEVSRFGQIKVTGRGDEARATYSWTSS